MLHHLWKALTAVMFSWYQGKLFIEHAVVRSCSAEATRSVAAK
jgi:hypothetical protein